MSHPSDHGAGTVEPGLTVIMDWMPGILQSTRVYIHFRLERPQDYLKFDLFQSICFASQQLQIAFDAWQDRGLSDFKGSFSALHLTTAASLTSFKTDSNLEQAAKRHQIAFKSMTNDSLCPAGRSY